MPPTSDTLQTLLRSLLRQDGPEQGKNRHVLSTLETINHDVFRLIALELYRTPRGLGLKALASCSRTVRDRASPILFFRCRSPPQICYPPDAIRPFARHITYRDGASIKILLEYFPSLISVTFEKVQGMSWPMLRICLSYPGITSLTFYPRAGLDRTRPYPLEEVANTSMTLSSFTYDTGPWRTLWHYKHMKLNTPPDIRTVVALESQSLEAVVLQMNQTLTQLSLSMESAPILRMAELSWPKLRALSIGGRYWTADQDSSLPVLLGALPDIEKLTVRICRGSGRPPILGQHSTPHSVLSGMRSLTVAYPDPEDDIFSIDTSHLHHLSLCDWPRHYNSLIYKHRYSAPSAYPILSSVECLSILRRMNLANLTSLELVYLADHAGTDDDLLQYVATTFPRLAHLELHRYRADRDEEVDHVHIARLLTAAQSLRTVRLNLDFRGDHGSYCGTYAVRTVWWERFTETLGWELADIMQDCPLLDCVEVLYHGYPTSTWVEFHPARCAEPRFVMSYDKDHSEPELMPHNWGGSDGPWCVRAGVAPTASRRIQPQEGVS